MGDGSATHRSRMPAVSVGVGSVRTMSSVRRLRPVWADATPDPDARPVQLTLDDLGTPLSDVKIGRAHV